MSYLSEFIKNEPSLKFLPLLHTCVGYDFRDIAKQNKLKTQQCDVFREDLLYFFYGRPAYRTSNNENVVSDPAFMPIVIMLNTSAVNAPRRIAPFDTGAYKLFAEEFMHPKMKCEDFLLDSNMEMPSKLISKFYETNKNYLEFTPRQPDIPFKQFEVKSYLKLIVAQQNSNYDDRKQTIEIQTDKNIELSADNILLVILPLVFMDDPEFRGIIENKWKVKYRTYSIHRGDPKEYIGLIYEKVTEYLEENKYL